jgi:hypothetical protein
MPLDYSKWDALEDSDDEEPPKSSSVSSNKVNDNGPQVPGCDKQSATVTAGFIVQTSASKDKLPVYINVCSSPVVPGGALKTTPSAVDGIDASFPYICGDLRTDDDGHGDCYVVELIIHPQTMVRADKDKPMAHAVIRTALAVVSQKALPVEETEWSLFTPDALKEVSGAYFFAPGKLVADEDLQGVE